jgi:hypothetical protein
MTERKKKRAKPPKDETSVASPTGLVAFLANSPLVGSGIDLERKPDYGRVIDLSKTE